MKKKYDLAVKVGEYETAEGKKNRYQNVGVVLEGEKGPFILLDKTFNPAGVQGDGKIIVSMFEPKEKQQGDVVRFGADEIPF